MSDALLKSKIFNLKSTKKGFTIVELLVVIVVIGILAAITLVSYTGITQRATAAALTSDLDNASKQLKLYQVLYGSYPTALDSNCPSTPTPDTNYCLKASSGNIFTYSSNGTTFSLTNEHNGTFYGINNTSSPIALAQPTSCPTGFIPVPGSPTYGQAGFCVMKYNAKADDNSDGIGDTNQTTGLNTWPANTYPISGSRKLVSTAAGYPVASITQATAITAAASYTANCGTGCHLLTEPEYMTIAQNVLGVDSNWSNAAGTVHTVGTGYIYSGHNDNVPANALEASADDILDYTGTGNSSPSNQRRTLTLSNGEVIWDLAGNVYEWTNATIGANLQPGLSGEVAYASKQWNHGLLLMNGLPYNSQPASTDIASITGWSSTQGIGQLYSDYGETVARAFLRGGHWSAGSYAGVLSLRSSYSAGSTNTYLGFRVSR